METIIIISLFIILLVDHQGVMTIQRPIGPSFISIINTKQKLYYNNLGTRLDCSARGNPLPVITWFRTNNTDERSLIPVQSSELIELYKNGSLFIRPFREYLKSIHAGSFICQAENPAGSIQSIPIQLKPQIYDVYEIEVKNPYGFVQSSVIISCEISPPTASSYVNIIGWVEKVNNQIVQLHLQAKTKYNFLSNKNLIIHNLTKLDDKKSYACIIENQIDHHIKQSPFKSLRVRESSPFGPELSLPNNTEYQAQSGDLIELPCGIASLPTNAQISWWKDGIAIENIPEKIYQHSLVLPLSFSSANDSGMYTCHIDDESIGRMTSMMSLKVNHPIQCQINIPQTNIDAGSSTQLFCTINSIQLTTNQWQWYHNSIPLSTKLDRYMITNATRKDMGMYQCCYIPSSSDVHSCCAQTQIRIINSPPFILRIDQTHVNSIIITRKTISPTLIDLNCTIYGDPIPEITIYKDGKKLLLNNQTEYLPSGDVFLHYPISLSHINDTGLYECLAKNSFGSISLSKHINIEEQKPFIQPLINQTIRTDQELTLSCYASGQPNLHLQWIDETNNRIVSTSSTSPVLFTSKNILSNVYSCRANNPYGEISSRLYLTIQNPARILSITPNKTIKINERLDIHCFAEGDHQLELSLKSPLMEKNHHNKKNLSIIIENIQMSDSGLYECYVKNNYSEDRAIFEIIVQNIPDRIQNIFIDHSERIFWMKPFDGNAKILKYILGIEYKQGLSWSNETMVTIDDNEITNYSFENIFSKCMISVIIQAVNIIGSSLPSNPIHFQTNMKPLRIAPYNLTAINISAKSVILTWQYPSFYICNDSSIKFVIEMTDQDNRTVIRTHHYYSTVLTINQLKSFTHYTFVIYAISDLGASPKSKPLKMQTIESVPLAMVIDLKARLLNSSTALITWTFEQDDHDLLNGQFRTYSVAIYQNFNMSTLTIIEAIDTHLILYNLHSSSQYFISVSLCNYYDCGTSSLAINIKTPPSSIANVPRNKPSSIRSKIHYRMPNEIGLKILYPSEIIENLIITYKIKNTSLINQFNIAPPLLNIRLTNLSCGNSYDIMIYAENQAGFSLTEYLNTETEGSVPLLVDSKDLFETISSNYIIFNMEKWIINECPILSYEIEIFPTNSSSQIYFHRYSSSSNRIQIDNLQPNQDYQLNIKIHSEAGEKIERISFRTLKDKNHIKIKNQQMIFLMIFIASFLLTLIFILIMMKILKNTELFVKEKRRLKPVVYSDKNHRYCSKTWVTTENDFTIENYIKKNRSDSFTSEDSQGNINPYAVTSYTRNYKDENGHQAFWKDNKHNQCQFDTAGIHQDSRYDKTFNPRPSAVPSERYFCPIVFDSSLSTDQTSLKQNPQKLPLTNHLSTVSSSADSGVHSSYTQSPRCPLRKISFDRTNQDNPLYATYDETNLPSYQHHQYSLV